MSTGPLRAVADDAVEIDVQVVPRASRSRVVGSHGAHVKVQIAAPPVDGAANAALVDLFADTLHVPKRAVTLVRGGSSKKKTIRIAGIDLSTARARLGLLFAVAIAGAPGSSGCTPVTTEISIRVLLPDDTTDLQRTDNVSITLVPDGFVDTVATDGLDFALSFALPPDETRRALSLYLAQGPMLLAWGRTPEITLRGAAAGLAVFVARPGGLTALPVSFDVPDPDALAAPISDVGVLVVAADGATLFVDAYDYEVRAAATMPLAIAPSDGALVPDRHTGVQRLAWHEALAVARYDPTTNAWTERALGDHGIAPRPGAAWAHDEAAGEVLVIGGGDATDVVAFALDPDADPIVRAPARPGLDVARPGASAIVARDDETVVTLVFGSADPDTPVAYWLEGQRALGPTAAWTAAQCVPLRATVPIAIVCAGGLRDDAPTADAIAFSWPSDAEPEAIEHVGLLGEPMIDPRWFADAVAVYAQGGGRLVAIDRATLTTTERAAASIRDTSGSIAILPNGFSLLVGGRAADGTPLPAWLVFAPEPTDADPS